MFDSSESCGTTAGGGAVAQPLIRITRTIAILFICASCHAKSWSTYDLRSLDLRPHTLNPERLAVDRAIERAFLQLDLDGITDIHGVGVEDGFPPVADA